MQLIDEIAWQKYCYAVNIVTLKRTPVGSASRCMDKWIQNNLNLPISQKYANYQTDKITDNKKIVEIILVCK